MHECNMNKDEMKQLLCEAFSCTVSMNGNYPYSVPVNFLYMNEKLYIHGQREGERARRLLADGKVCVNVYEQYGTRVKPAAKYMCNVNTIYRSVIIYGQACAVNGEKAIAIMAEHTKKYRPEMTSLPISEKLMERCVVFEITPEKMTGKSYNII